MNFQGKDYGVEELKEDSFKACPDLALFSVGSDVSRQFAPIAAAKGCIVVDNSSAWRMDPGVPLVVPEINPEDVAWHKGIISNPNCSTIQMVAALAPLHKKAVMKRIIVSTYQSVSGSGGAAMRELQQQINACATGCDAEIKEYPYQIHCNLIPQISKLKDEFPGYYGEEIKMIKETRKIFGCHDLAVSATCVRVPVIRAHSETINVEFKNPITADEARAILSASPGIEVIDDPENGKYPMPLFADGTDPVYVGRIRQDSCCPNTLDMWVVADNIRKGAALNAVQIAECMIERGLIEQK
jgi:aspartate-semialdehyde dehydrogenase